MKKVKRKASKNKKNKKNILLTILDILIVIIFTILTSLLIINLIKLSNIETLLRIIISIILTIILVILIIFRRKKKLLCRIIIIILTIIYAFINYTFYKIYQSLDNITNNVETKGICLVTNLNNIETLDDITNEKIAIIEKDFDQEFHKIATDILKEKKLKNELTSYDDYLQIINALLNNDISYAFLPENYDLIYKAASGNEEEKLEFTVLYNEQKAIENSNLPTNTKLLDEPFTILLMGTDVILDSYNADTLMLLTVNPKTMKITMLSIPRDTYTTIACTGGKHKINSSGWYGDNCVVRTVANYLDIKIDYYAKINFNGIVELVDVLGGVEVDVPYSFCEQNSKRQFGNNMIYVDEGLQTLDGEQALALSRNRHYWSGMCDKKYTTDGERSDITRGENQQLVLKSIMSKIMTIRDINTFYKLLDTISKNMTTNMSKETILSFYNIGKEVVKRFNASNVDEIIDIDRLTFKSYSTMIYLSGLELSMIVNYDESVTNLSKEMKKNLGLLKKETIKTFSFDINEEYDPTTIKYNRLTSNLTLLPNFVGKPLSEAIKYCNQKGLDCESSTTNNNEIILTQSIPAKSDIATIKNKTITFTTETTTESPTEKPLEKPNINEENKPTEETPDKEPTDKPEEDNNNTDDSTNKEPGTNENTPEEPKKEETPESNPEPVPVPTPGGENNENME